MTKKLRNGEPCSHKGCLQHITHSCETCGRIGGIMKDPIEELISVTFKRKCLYVSQFKPLLEIIRIQHEALWRVWDTQEEPNCNCGSTVRNVIDKTNGIAKKCLKENHER